MSGTQSVTKLDAARRQLDTAIELWFHDKDEVSILTLSYAAYEVIHTVSKKRGRKQPLIFDSDVVKPEFRRLLASHIKKAPNFFKHADHDSEGTVEFKPVMSEILFIFSIMGLQSIGISSNDYELAFSWWFNLTRPNLLSKHGRELIAKSLPVDAIAEVKGLAKSEFFEQFLQARRSTLPPVM
jgi:hypothetical protein